MKTVRVKGVVLVKRGGRLYFVMKFPKGRVLLPVEGDNVDFSPLGGGKVPLTLLRGIDRLPLPI